MKLKQTLLALMLLTGVTALSQTIAINSTDAKTGDVTIQTTNHKGKDFVTDDSVAKKGLVFFSAGYQKTNVKGKSIESYFIDIDLYHHDNRLGCLKQGANNITLELEDGTEIKCFQISDTDCHHEAFKAAFAMTAKNGNLEEMEANFKKLQTVAVKRIIITTTERTLDYKVKDDAKDIIKAHFALVAKTLNRA